MSQLSCNLWGVLFPVSIIFRPWGRTGVWTLSAYLLAYHCSGAASVSIGRSKKSVKEVSWRFHAVEQFFSAAIWITEIYTASFLFNATVNRTGLLRLDGRNIGIFHLSARRQKRKLTEAFSLSLKFPIPPACLPSLWMGIQNCSRNSCGVSPMCSAGTRFSASSWWSPIMCSTKSLVSWNTDVHYCLVTVSSPVPS